MKLYQSALEELSKINSNNSEVVTLKEDLKTVILEIESTDGPYIINSLPQEELLNEHEQTLSFSQDHSSSSPERENPSVGSMLQHTFLPPPKDGNSITGTRLDLPHNQSADDDRPYLMSKL